eukprot:TRINITY_DN4949_c0_g1_i1.p1 TRINITY_DN4949_c0_g1~~TRINITY_DN4949_c0_g1_i1.p1  ORF type:complete len:338 (-),score=72.50 TRINITY_DN4949_c0_g1_i1:44-1057(-)
MGNEQSSISSVDPKSIMGKRPPPSAVKNTSNVNDRNIILPSEYANTSKDICHYIRNIYDIEENQSIQTTINYHCQIDGIKKSIFDKLKDDEKTFPVRLYISSQAPKDFFGKLVGMTAKFSQEVGAHHLAIQICDKIVHWVGASLVIVKKFSGSNCLALLYPQKEGKEFPSIENTKNNRDIICQIIQKWNCTKIYSGSNHNCQHFTSEIFEALGLDFKFSKMQGPVGDFIKYISQYSNEELFPCIVQDGEVLEEWKTHYALDDWSQEYVDRESKYYYLIKGFHRGFQVKQEVGFPTCPDGDATLLEKKVNGPQEQEFAEESTSGVNESNEISSFSQIN